MFDLKVWSGWGDRGEEGLVIISGCCPCRVARLRRECNVDVVGGLPCEGDEGGEDESSGKPEGPLPLPGDAMLMVSRLQRDEEVLGQRRDDKSERAREKEREMER